MPVSSLGPARAARLLASPVGRAALRGRGPLARMLRSALARRLDTDEVAAIDRIERVRHDLEARADTVPFEEADGTHRRAVGELCRTASKSPRWAELLFRLVRAARPERCLELGTCVGLSAAYQGAALELNGTGRLVTVEGRAAVATVAADTLSGLDLSARVEGRIGWFDDVLDDALSDLGHVDQAFIDGHHQGEATLRYFRTIKPRLSSGAIVIVDDIAWSSDMRTAWDRVCADADTADALDLGQLGIWRCRADLTGDERAQA